MTKQELLINPADIRTMQKDIRQIRKFGVIQKPGADFNIDRKDVQGIQKGEVAKKEASEKELIEKIIDQSAKQRYFIEQLQVKTDILNNKPVNTPGIPHIKVKEQYQEQLNQPKEVFQKREGSAMQKITVTTPEQQKTILGDEKERRKKFMEEIEMWARENK